MSSEHSIQLFGKSFSGARVRNSFMVTTTRKRMLSLGELSGRFHKNSV